MMTPVKIQEWQKQEQEDSDDEDDDMKADEMTQKHGARRHDHDLWPRSKPHDYSHLHGDLEHTMLTQYNAKKGLKLFSVTGMNALKLFGEAGMNALVTEMQQLHDRVMVIPKHTNMVMQEKKQQSLQYLMFTK